MIKFVVLSLLFVGSYAFNVKIVNGTDAHEGEFPYVVSLRNDVVHHSCGATILNKDFVLTAAHCVCNITDGSPLDPTNFTIQYGSVNISADMTRSVQVKKINCNKFDFEQIIFDSAVLELETSIPEGNWSAVDLAKEFNTSTTSKGVIVGWGRIYDQGPIPTTLQKLNVVIYPDIICGILYKPEHHICFGADVGGACNGDSGTCLLVDDVQVGIASFINAKCGVANILTPNVYARVSRYYEWIASIAGL